MISFAVFRNPVGSDFGSSQFSLAQRFHQQLDVGKLDKAIVDGAGNWWLEAIEEKLDFFYLNEWTPKVWLHCRHYFALNVER